MWCPGQLQDFGSLRKMKDFMVAIDCGIKAFIRSLNRRGCRVTVVPWDTPAEKILGFEPDGICVSNGLGDPTDVPETIDTVKKLVGRRPVFGICLGHQIVSLAYGAKTYKLKFGHRGGNHPVRSLLTGKLKSLHRTILTRLTPKA